MKAAQSCPTLSEPMDCIVRGILQARILEWVAVPSSRGSSQPKDWTQVFLNAAGVFTIWATGEWNNIQKSAQIISLIKVDPSRPKIRLPLRVLLHHSPLPLPYKYCKQYPDFEYHKPVSLVLNLLQMESLTIQYMVLSQRLSRSIR